MEIELNEREILRLYTILQGVREKDRKGVMKAEKENAIKIERYYKTRLEEDDEIIKKLNKAYIAELQK